jgi:hypothetical protein
MILVGDVDEAVGLIGVSNIDVFLATGTKCGDNG